MSAERHQPDLFGGFDELPPAAPYAGTPAEQAAARALQASGRRHTHCRAILARLQQGPVTNTELAQGYGLRYGARIYDLRGVVHYRLVRT